MEAEIFKPHVGAGVGKAVSRNKIVAFEKALGSKEDAFFGDSANCPLEHSFCEGMYVRKIFLPAGTFLTGKIHKHEHPNFLLQGRVSVATEQGVEELTAPQSMISKAGTKRAIHVHEDSIWVTVHGNPTNTQDLSELEQMTIAPSYEQYDEFRKQLLEGTATTLKEETSCGLAALRKICELKSTSVKTLIAIAKDNGISLSAYNVPKDKIASFPRPAIFHSNNHFAHVGATDAPADVDYTGVILSKDNSLPYAKIAEAEQEKITGQTWVAVGVGAFSAGTAIFGSIKAKQAAEAQRKAAEAQRLAEEAEAKRLAAEAAAKKSGHVMFYVGIGAGVLALTGLLWYVVKKKKQ